MAKKKESMIGEVKDLVEETLDKADEIIEDVVEGSKKAISKVDDMISGKEKSAKKTSDKKDSIDKKAKLAALLEKAKALEGGISGSEKVDIKGKVKGEDEEKKDMLVPIEDYLKASTHLGTRVITPDMKPYVYRRRADGLAVFNTSLQDDMIRKGAEFLANYAPEQIVITCKREAGWKAVETFSNLFGIKVFTKKYPAGTLTNPNLEDFFEKDLVLICDPWLDKNILSDAKKIKIPVMAICDTNNYTQGIDNIIPANNKSFKSIGMVFYLLARLYAAKRGIKIEIPPIQEFVEGWDQLQPPQ